MEVVFGNECFKNEIVFKNLNVRNNFLHLHFSFFLFPRYLCNQKWPKGSFINHKKSTEDRGDPEIVFAQGCRKESVCLGPVFKNSF